MSAPEPVGLHEIAEAIRDQCWLDMRHIEYGTCERLRVKQLNISRERDDLVVEQRWVDGEEVASADHTFDAEDIRWLRATQVALDDVKPILVPATPKSAKHIIDEIIRTVAFLTQDVSEKHLREGRRRTGCVRPRQEAIWLAYEMTDAAASDICTQHFGYASVQPFITISDRVRWARENANAVHYDEPVGAWEIRARSTARLVESTLGYSPRRSAPPKFSVFA